MALNYSHQPVFSAHIPEDRIANGHLMECIPEKNGEGYSRSWYARGESDEWNFSCGDRVDRCSPPESTSNDMVDLLPSDPFGMYIETNITAFTELRVDYGGYMSNNGKASKEDNGLFAGLNFIWNHDIKLQPFHTNVQLNENLNVGIQPFPKQNPDFEKLDMGTHFFPSTSKVNQHSEERDIMGFGYWGTSCSSEFQSREEVECAANIQGMPHEAMVFALGYLGVKDLLSVERVCRTLCSIVRGDPLLWMNIHIDQPLNERIKDDDLVQLANRAQGNLQCLSLVECLRITDDGLRRILETNPRLTKLFVPGCTKLRIDRLLNNIKKHNSNKDFRGIKHLRIAKILGVTREHFEELKLLLGADDHNLENYHNPPFYHRGNLYLPYDDDRAIDIEMCPWCEEFKLVYDCPAESCQVTREFCRACTRCIARCIGCGRCINGTEYEETFSLQLQCSDCCKQLIEYGPRFHASFRG
ncbi:hypothetical protein RD792_008754 [Penstemon davidsonii]|uniref:F-box domain-containing protein n=1 Tax=Penstemon davidsonii TaxID=160366 RepID=A0ABR0DB57_9LAMI|nr:hypothetical protein RD792_008754 [Penstemon davidsonii]